MKALIALEELIKQDEAHIKLSKKQLSQHEAGEIRLTPLVKASTESGLYESTKRLEKNKLKLDELLKHDLQELEKEERMKDAVVRKNYFHYQKSRIKRDKLHPTDVKLEAMLIIDEIPVDKDIGIEDDILFSVAEKSYRMQLTLHEKIDTIMREVRERFEALLGKLSEEEISELGLLSHQITIIVVHIIILIENIQEVIDEKNEQNEKNDREKIPDFKGLPKYEDWWIKELWSSHQAYFGLLKWKQIISNMCQTQEQKEAWDIIFANWVHIKKYLNTKGAQAHQYTFAFDEVLSEFCDLKEELDIGSLESMESIIGKLSAVEDFSKHIESHKLITDYTQFKRDKLNFVDKKMQKPQKAKN